MAIDISSIKFHSDDHIRYENGRVAVTSASDAQGHNKGCNRGIQIEPNVWGGEGFTVTMYNLDGNHPFWGNNVQMAPKQMKIISSNIDKIVLRGFGHDPLGNSFADYGLTIYHNGQKPIRMILHMHDRGIDIEYFEKNDHNNSGDKVGQIKKALENLKTKNTEFDSFEPFMELKPFEFSFHANRFEIWQKGSLVDSGRNSTSIIARVIPGKSIQFEMMHIAVINSRPFSYLTDSNLFTFMTTQKDRILLVNLPVSEVEDSNAMGMFRMMANTIGQGRNIPNYERPELLKLNQPFACSLFLQNKKIAKVTFSVNKPETLIEFYID